MPGGLELDPPILDPGPLTVRGQVHIDSGTNIARVIGLTPGAFEDVAGPVFFGLNVAGPAQPFFMTPTQSTALLDVFTSALKGLAPASGGGTTNFLRADGTWAVPPGTGGGGAGWDDVLAVDNHSGANNVFVDTGQYLNLGTTTPTQVTGDIRASGNLLIHPDTGFEVQAHDAIYIHGPDTILIESTGGSPVRLLTDVTVELESTSGPVELNASTFVDLTNGFLRFQEQAASTPSMTAGKALFWVRNDTPNIPMFTDDGNVDFKLLKEFALLADLQNIATSRILGRVTAGSGDIEELTGTQATSLLDVFTSGLKGLVPASGGGTTNFLRADGTFAVPPGTGATTGLQFVTYGAEATLSNERVTTASTSITINTGVANQIAFERAALTGDVTAAANSNTTAFRSFGAKSVLANATNAGAVPSDLAGSAAFQHLRVNSANTGLEWSVLTTGDFPANSVPLTALATIATDTLLANITAGTATPVAVGFATIDSASIVWDAATHTFQLGAASGGDITRAQASVTYTINNNVVTNAKAAQMAALTVKANATNVLANAQDVASAADDTVFRRTATTLNWGQLTVGMAPNDLWTYAKIQNVSATSRILGRITAGAGDIEELTGTQATTLLDVFTTALKGLVPASGGGTTNFLRADGTFAAPPGTFTALSGAVVSTGTGGATTFAGILDNGAAETDRTNLNFLNGDSITSVITDDAVNNELEIRHHYVGNTAEIVLNAPTGNLGTINIASLTCGGTYRITNAAAGFNIEGFTAKPVGFWFHFYWDEALTDVATFNNEDVTATAANRLRMPRGEDMAVDPPVSGMFVYGGDSRWHWIGDDTRKIGQPLTHWSVGTGGAAQLFGTTSAGAINLTAGGTGNIVCTAGGSISLLSANLVLLQHAGGDHIQVNAADGTGGQITIQGSATGAPDVLAAGEGAIWMDSAGTDTLPMFSNNGEEVLPLVGKPHRLCFWSEDFDVVSGSLATSILFCGESNWLFDLYGAAGGSATALAAEADHPGILRISTHTVQSTAAGIYRGNTAGTGLTWVRGDMIREYTVIAKFPDSTTVNWFMGFSSDANLDTQLGNNALTTATDFLGFFFDTAGAFTDTTVHCCSREASGVALNTDSNITPGTGWRRYTIRQNVLGTVEYLIDDTIVATHASQIPDAETLNCGVIILTRAVGAARVMDIDYIDFHSHVLTR
mgnify:CR=1 FL=1